MCGIAGYYSAELTSAHVDVRIMTQALAHRGPDAEGSYTADNVSLGQRRLSIIDLSESANQPMISPCGRYVMAYNGEIYNFKVLRQYLEQHFTAYTWRTQSDTEVVLAAFMYYGKAFVSHLKGMFAIAIYDTHTHILYMYRDRVGIKPLYYYWQNNTLVFASELKAITALPMVKHKLTVNAVAVNHYLYTAYIPAPHTIYEQIYKFPQGSYAEYDGQNLNIYSYWQLPTAAESEYMSDEHSAKQHLRSLLEHTVEQCMFSDVPMGSFLSGGIDSSTITAVAQSLSATPVNTFSIGFYDVHNEAGYAARVAHELGTCHHELYVKEQDAIDMIPLLLQVYDEPYADSSAIPTMLLSHMTREHVTMALSGDGGDELFMGYGAYTWAHRLAHPALYAMRYPIAMALAMGGNREQRVARLMRVPGRDSMKSHIFSQEQFCFSQQEIQRLLIPATACAIDENKVNAMAATAEERQALYDFHYYLPDDLLVKVDRASMRYSLEVRVPFLEQDIVEYAYSLPLKWRWHNGEGKYLLKQVLYDYLPQSMMERPKWGFSVPLQRWLQGDLGYLIDTWLSREAVERTQVLRWNVVERYIQQFRSGHGYMYNRLWLMIVLQQFLLRE